MGDRTKQNRYQARRLKGMLRIEKMGVSSQSIQTHSYALLMHSAAWALKRKRYSVGSRRGSRSFRCCSSAAEAAEVGDETPTLVMEKRTDIVVKLLR